MLDHKIVVNIKKLILKENQKKIQRCDHWFVREVEDPLVTYYIIIEIMV